MAKYRIEIKRSALKEIKKLSQNHVKKIVQKIRSLSADPRPHGCEKLSDQEKYRVRVGQYRIVYSIIDEVLVVYVIKVGHRRDIYRIS